MIFLLIIPFLILGIYNVPTNVIISNSADSSTGDERTLSSTAGSFPQTFSLACEELSLSYDLDSGHVWQWYTRLLELFEMITLNLHR